MDGPAVTAPPLPPDYAPVTPPTIDPQAAPPEFEPVPPPGIPSPIAPLQPHPDYPDTYPPPSQGRPTETGPKKVYYHQKPSGAQFIGGAPRGDMQVNEYATNGEWGVVDWAQRASWTAAVPWSGITGMPAHIGTYWWVGSGPPGNIPGANPGDLYLDEVTGNVYQLS